jgi:hypothetical protein
MAAPETTRTNKRLRQPIWPAEANDVFMFHLIAGFAVNAHFHSLISVQYHAIGSE